MAHGLQAQTVGPPLRGQAFAIVAHDKFDLMRRCVEAHVNAGRAAVFDRVVDGFLSEAIQMRSRGRVVEQHGGIGIETTFDIAVASDTIRQILQGGHQTVRLRRNGVKSAGDGAGVGERLLDEMMNLSGPVGLLCAAFLKVALKEAAEEEGAAQLLAQTIMQVARDATTFLFGCSAGVAFEPFALGEVANQAGEEALAAEVDFAHGKVNGKHRAVLALADDFAADADDSRVARGEVARHVVVMLRSIRLRHENAHVLANHLAGAVAEHLLGCGVHRVHDAVMVNGDDALDGCADDGLKPLLAVVQIGGALGDASFEVVCGLL